MQQLTHIFRKDVRHFWREIIVVLLLVTLYGWHETQTWKHGDVAYGIAGMLTPGFLLGLVVALLPIAWVIVITRIVHDESLVGDRQFWVTRPYQWQQLLAEKILFVLTFICLPVFLLQVLLLARAGFSPAPYLAGLIGVEIGTALILLLPAFVLSSITRSLPQLGLVIVCLLVYLIFGSYAISFYRSSNLTESSDQPVAIAAVAIACTVIIIQYARRKTRTSLFVLTGFGLALLAAGFINSNSSIDGEYPPKAAVNLASVQLALKPSDQGPGGYLPPGRAMVYMPMAVTGVTDPWLPNIVGHRAIIETSSGERWDSNWQTAGNFLFPDRKGTTIGLLMDREIYDHFKTTPVKMTLKLAWKVYENRDGQELIVPSGPFELTGVGRCSVNPLFGRQLLCLAPLHRPEFLVIKSDLSRSTCLLSKNQTAAFPAEIGRGYVLGGKPNWIQPGISPIAEFDLNLTDYERADDHVPHEICAGTPIVVSQPELAYKTQTEISFPKVALGDYAIRIGR